MSCKDNIRKHVFAVLGLDLRSIEIKLLAFLHLNRWQDLKTLITSLEEITQL